MYQTKDGIEWDELQLVDLLLPALSALETTTEDNAAVKIRWIKRNITYGEWYRALMSAMAHVIIDVAKLMIEQSIVLKQKPWQIDLPRPAVRKILWDQPTFKITDVRMTKHGLNELVPLRVTARAPWIPDTDISAFVGPDFAWEGVGRVLRPKDVEPDDLTVDTAHQQRMDEQAQTSDQGAQDNDREYREQTTAAYADQVSALGWEHGYLEN